MRSEQIKKRVRSKLSSMDRRLPTRARRNIADLIVAMVGSKIGTSKRKVTKSAKGRNKKTAKPNSHHSNLFLLRKYSFQEQTWQTWGTLRAILSTSETGRTLLIPQKYECKVAAPRKTHSSIQRPSLHASDATSLPPESRRRGKVHPGSDESKSRTGADFSDPRFRWKNSCRQEILQFVPLTISFRRFLGPQTQNDQPSAQNRALELSRGSLGAEIEERNEESDGQASGIRKKSRFETKTWLGNRKERIFVRQTQN